MLNLYRVFIGFFMFIYSTMSPDKWLKLNKNMLKFKSTLLCDQLKY